MATAEYATFFPVSSDSEDFHLILLPY